ncbi:MAG: hypothetical protein AAFV53_08630 [Myxococcota bacterium]
MHDAIPDLREALSRLDPTVDDLSSAQPLLDAARAVPALAADWRIAAARLNAGEALRLLRDALTHLPDPDRLSERQMVHERLGLLRLAGGDRDRGRHHLEAALTIARRLSDRPSMGRLSGRLGALLVGLGLPDDGEPLLMDALADATWRGDTLREVGLCTVLAALRMRQEDWDAARGFGARTVQAAVSRGNWLGVADGLIVQSVCLMRQDKPEQALQVVLYGTRRLTQAGSRPALNLLKAHITALRSEMGSEAFDDLFAAARSQTNTM